MVIKIKDLRVCVAHLFILFVLHTFTTGITYHDNNKNILLVHQEGVKLLVCRTEPFDNKLVCYYLTCLHVRFYLFNSQSFRQSIDAVSTEPPNNTIS